MGKISTLTRARELLDEFEKNGDSDINLGFMVMVNKNTETVEAVTFNADKRELILLVTGLLIELKLEIEKELDEDRVLN